MTCHYTYSATVLSTIVVMATVVLSTWCAALDSVRCASDPTVSNEGGGVVEGGDALELDPTVSPGEGGGDGFFTPHTE